MSYPERAPQTNLSKVSGKEFSGSGSLAGMLAGAAATIVGMITLFQLNNLSNGVQNSAVQDVAFGISALTAMGMIFGAVHIKSQSLQTAMQVVAPQYKPRAPQHRL